MTYRLIIAIRQFYKRRENVTKRAKAENDMTIKCHDNEQ